MSADKTQTEGLSRSTLHRPAVTRASRATEVVCLTLIFHPDLRRTGEIVLLGELSAGRQVEVSRKLPVFQRPNGTRSRPLADRYLSRSPILLSATGDGGIEVAAARLRPAWSSTVTSSARRDAWWQMSVRAASFSRSQTASSSCSIVGCNQAIEQVRQEIESVADLDVPMLARGETGTGKELVASALHALSKRRSAEMVAVNLASIAPSLATAALFGSIRGAFTGSVRAQDGYFVRADMGSQPRSRQRHSSPAPTTSAANPTIWRTSVSPCSSMAVRSGPRHAFA